MTPSNLVLPIVHLPFAPGRLCPDFHLFPFILPGSMRPVRVGIGCAVASCEVDLNMSCPSALEVKKGGKVVGCKSACHAMQSAKYCCMGENVNPKVCKPTMLVYLFKAICPKAYSYSFDDVSSLNKCRAPRYTITFCPPK